MRGELLSKKELKELKKFYKKYRNYLAYVDLDFPKLVLKFGLMNYHLIMKMKMKKVM